MGGSQADILEMFLMRGYLSPEALKILKTNGERKGIPLLESALLSGVLHPDARSFLLADALGLPFEEVDPGAVPMGLSELVGSSSSIWVSPIAKKAILTFWEGTSSIFSQLNPITCS